MQCEKWKKAKKFLSARESGGSLIVESRYRAHVRETESGGFLSSGRNLISMEGSSEQVVE